MSISDPTIGEITLFAGNFAPRSWAFCDGQLLPINQNQALFSILGTTYGGDGRTTFGLPDLRGRIPLHPGTGPGLPAYSLGQKGGNASVTLTENQLPRHSHTATLHGETAVGDKASPLGNMLAGTTSNPYAAPNANDNIAMGSDSVTVSDAGGGRSYDNMNPYLGVNVIIALGGQFPSRN